jgi:hypothetical protein
MNSINMACNSEKLPLSRYVWMKFQKHTQRDTRVKNVHSVFAQNLVLHKTETWDKYSVTDLEC